MDSSVGDINDGDINNMLCHFEWLSSVSEEAKDDHCKFIRMNREEKINFLILSSECNKVYKYIDWCPISRCNTSCEFSFASHF